MLASKSSSLFLSAPSLRLRSIFSLKLPKLSPLKVASCYKLASLIIHVPSGSFLVSIHTHSLGDKGPTLLYICPAPATSRTVSDLLIRQLHVDMISFPRRSLSSVEIIVVADDDILPTTLGVQHFDFHAGLNGLRRVGLGKPLMTWSGSATYLPVPVLFVIIGEGT